MKIFISVLAFTLVNITSFPQNPEWIIYNNQNTGLSDNSLESIAFGNDGSKWFAGDGLYHFDNKVWTFIDISASGLNTSISCIAIDSLEQLWLGTYDGLICTDLSNWTVYTTANSGLASNKITDIAVAPDGKVWIGTWDAGIASFDGSNWTVYNETNSGLPGNIINCLAIAPAGELWIGTRYDGASCFDGINWMVYNNTNTGIDFNSVVDIALEESGTAWLSLYNSYYSYAKGAASFDGTTWTWYSSIPGFGNSMVSCIAIDSLQHKWFGFGNGVTCFDGTNWTSYYPDPHPGGLGSPPVNNIEAGPDGKLWFAMGGKNFFIYPYCLASYDGMDWVYYNNENTGLPSNDILCMAAEPNGNVWFGTLQYSEDTFGGAACYTGYGWTTAYNTDNSGISGDYIVCMAMEENGNKWFGVMDFYGAGSCGVANFDGTNWTFYNTSNSGLPSDFVFDIAIDHDGNKWFATNGIAMFDGVNWIVYDTSNSGLPANGARDIAIDPEGNKWFATIGATMFDGANWLNYNTGNSGMPSDFVTCIAFDDNGNKWFGTYDAGLARFDGTNWTIYNSTNSELVSDWIAGIATDDYGNLWAVPDGCPSGSGVAMFDGTTWTIYNSANTPIPVGDISCLVIDAYNNKWFGFHGGGEGSPAGAVVFNENGVITHTARQETIAPDLTVYPNPFGGMLNIGYSLTETRKVVINLYSSEGKLVRNICSGNKAKGDYKESVDGASLPEGIYIITLTLDSFPASRKVIKIN